MIMADMCKLMEFLQKEVPSNAGDLISSLNLCIKNIDTIRTLLRDKSIELQQFDDHSKLDKSVECTQANKMLLNFKEYLEKYVNVTDVAEDKQLYNHDETDSEINEEISENNDSSDKKEDDKKYLTDPTIPYSLSEKLITTTPCKFSYKRRTYDISSYKDLWIKLCEILYEKDRKRFEDIAKFNKLYGDKISYITYKDDEIAKNIKPDKSVPLLNTNIILYTNMSIPQIIKRIEELFDIYKISLSSIKLYLRNDRNPKAGRYPVGKYLDNTFDYKSVIKEKQNSEKHNDVKEKSKIKISQVAYDYFQNYFKNTELSYDIQNFLDKDWCSEIFNIPYPVFKQVDNTKPLKEQTFTEDKNYAHYAQGKQVIIGGKSYMIYMLWNEKMHRSKLEKWIIEHPISDSVQDINSKMNVYVIPKNKAKICKKCGKKTLTDNLLLTYYKGDANFEKDFYIRRCKNCDLIFMSEGTYNMYSSSSDVRDPNVNFIFD